MSAAKARRNAEPPLIVVDRLPYRVEEPIGRRLALAQVTARDQGGELVAAYAEDTQVGLSEDPRHPDGRLLEDLVAGVVAEGVVDRLESVQVEVHEGDPLGFARGRDARHRMYPLIEGVSIPDSGQAVSLHEVAQLVLGLDEAIERLGSVQGRARGPRQALQSAAVATAKLEDDHALHIVLDVEYLG